MSMSDKERVSAFQKGWDAADGKGCPLNPYPYDLQPELFREFVRGYREGKAAKDPEHGSKEEFRRTCPDCYTELVTQPRGGVKCPKCGYWFCF